MKRFKWKAQGDANFYVILNEDNWFAAIHLNGEMLPTKQEEYMDKFVSKLNEEN